jgi:hypothetical protein
MVEKENNRKLKVDLGRNANSNRKVKKENSK